MGELAVSVVFVLLVFAMPIVFAAGVLVLLAAASAATAPLFGHLEGAGQPASHEYYAAGKFHLVVVRDATAAVGEGEEVTDSLGVDAVYRNTVHLSRK